MPACRYSLVLFDFDETLVDFGVAQRSALAAVCRSWGVPPSPLLEEAFLTINAALWAAFERGDVSKEEVLLRRFELLRERFGLEGDAALGNELFLETLAEAPRLLNGAREIVTRLHGSCRLGIVTNGSARTQRLRLERSGLSPFFDFMVVSDEVGFGKPDRRIFERALSLASHVGQGRVLMVGDNLQADVKGALGAGLEACWLNPRGGPVPPDVSPTFVIRSLEALGPLLFCEEI